MTETSLSILLQILSSLQGLPGLSIEHSCHIYHTLSLFNLFYAAKVGINCSEWVPEHLRPVAQNTGAPAEMASATGALSSRKSHHDSLQKKLTPLVIFQIFSQKKKSENLNIPFAVVRKNSKYGVY